MRVVILEDDKDQADLLVAWLEEAGHQCTVHRDGNAFIRGYNKDSYDIVLLDWMVPSLSGLEVLKHMRSHLDNVVPVVFITQKDSEEDVVQALEAGADDYMTKPVRQLETMARVNAIARRMGFSDEYTPDNFDLPPYQLDSKSRQVKLNGRIVEMTQKEYEVTLFLFKNLGRVISRGHLLEMVWGTTSNLNTRTVDTHISRLRSKLMIEHQENWRLNSVYRHGYRLEQV
ncbi:MAG: response regulator transcription factor [Gammaproteobacteria bacterium]|nr:response regulator transcription factor [Gammaproteobacteria bacterium]